MRTDTYYTLAFDSTHSAVAAEKYLSGSISVSVMPTLRKITASCGISLRIEPQDLESLLSLLRQNRQVRESCRLYIAKNEDVFPMEI